MGLDAGASTVVGDAVAPEAVAVDTSAEEFTRAGNA